MFKCYETEHKKQTKIMIVMLPDALPHVFEPLRAECMADVEAVLKTPAVAASPLMCVPAREFTRGEALHATGASSGSRRDMEGADSMPPHLCSPRTRLFLQK